MNEQKTRIDNFYSRIKNNPVIASLIVIGSIIIALSTFTNAAKDLLGLIKPITRANINGEWIAEVPYDWNNKTFNEIFTFKGEGEELYGTASLFRRKRSIVEGTIKKDKIEFVTQTQEFLDDANNPKEVTHHYRGIISGDQIKLVLTREGGYTAHNPIEFTANRVLSHSFDSTN